MKLRVIALLSAVGLGAVSLATSSATADEGGKKQGDKAAAAQGAAGSLPAKVTIRNLPPKGLAWGMSLRQLSRLYEKVFSEEFLPLYKKVEPGVEMKALDAELEDKKGLILRNRIDFGNLPTGMDSTPMKGEYTYNNGEFMTRVTLRSGTVRNFFFFDDKLWKIYDEHNYKKGGALGENFEDAIKYLSKRFKSTPKINEADYKEYQFKEARWQNGDLVIRALDRGNSLGIAYIDRTIQDNLAKYRKNKAQENKAIDKDVSDVLRKDEPAPTDKSKAEDAKGKGKAKGKKGKAKAKPEAEAQPEN